MNYWHAFFLFAAFYCVHFVLSLRQMRNFAQQFTELRKQGPVVIGKHQGLFTWGAIVMFLIDKNGVISDGKCLTGVTVFSRFRSFAKFNGDMITDVAPKLDDKNFMSKAMKKAVLNAVNNYTLFKRGVIPQDPPGPLMKIYRRFKGEPSRRK